MHRVHTQNPPNKHSVALQRDINDLRLAQRINRAKADVDNGPPPPLPHLDARGKQRQVEKERQEDIERNNRTLLTRIEHHFTSGKSIDCHLVQYGPRSLNRISRESELRKITQENRRLHNAIINQKPVLVAAKLEAEFQKNQKAFEHLCQNKIVINKNDRRKECECGDQDEEVKYQGQIEEEIRQKLEQQAEERKEKEKELKQSQGQKETIQESQKEDVSETQKLKEDIPVNKENALPVDEEQKMPEPFEYVDDADICLEKDDGFTGNNIYLTQ
ncbi:hypothetical protein SS50377_28579 [Spironucleus salmonicida]|uniref:Uncharacterized protein n=1 Tax=Spironucleus salmonicida TaxID=348837 RepID=V6LD40_9EUKA|nr:hypothetical protein SS50377_28579 [Spironucleus salmonicida]|eukprot:EST41596.1 hypothetical protein SS50377_18938 [Spironucleus salmonicida]